MSLTPYPTLRLKLTMPQALKLQFLPAIGIPGPQGPTGAQGPTGPGVPVGGTTGQMLSKNSATNFDTIWATPTSAAPGTRVLIQTQTVSSAVAQVDFTTGIDSTYDEYELQFYGVRPSSNAPLFLRISQDGGATWKSAASDYVWNMYSAYVQTASSSAAGGTTGQLQLSGTTSSAAETAAAGVVRFFLPSSSTLTKQFIWDTAINSPLPGGGGRNTGSGYYITNSNSINGVRFFMGSSITTATGTFNLYGIKK